MSDVLVDWSPDFVVSLVGGGIVPLIVAGVVIAGIFWIVGYLIDHLFRLIR